MTDNKKISSSTQTISSSGGEKTLSLQEKTSNILINILKVLLLVMFLPVLFCVIFIGAKMNYTQNLIPSTVCSNIVIALVAVLGLAVYFVLAYFLDRKELSNKWNLIIDGILLVIFTITYFVNYAIIRETAFALPWDVGVVQSSAYNLVCSGNADPVYFSIYPNNIPITCLMEKMYRFAVNHRDWGFVIPECIYFQFACLMFSIGGFFACITVKKVTNRLFPVLAVFMTTFVLVIISPWKMAPYTDAFTVAFPIVSVYCYVSSLKSDKIWQKALWNTGAIAIAGLGGILKPNLFLLIVALMCVEILNMIKDFKQYWKLFLIDCLLVLLLLVGKKVSFNKMVEDYFPKYNAEVSYSWEHYFMMGMNEETTGSYSSEDAGFINDYQTDKDARKKAEIKEAFNRIGNRGFFGSIRFALQKLTMTFNEASFGWSGEVWKNYDYPAELRLNTSFQGLLNEIFIDGRYKGAYNTICQTVWFFALLTIPGVAIVGWGKKSKKDNSKNDNTMDDKIDSLGNESQTDKEACLKKKSAVLIFFVITFIGILMYQLLLEARARYLFSLLPVILTISACGLNEFKEVFYFGENRENRTSYFLGSVLFWRKPRK